MRKKPIRSGRSKHIMNAPLLYCGLDVHRNGLSYATVVDELGNVVEERKIRNDSITQFLDAYHPVRVAMEASTAIHQIYKEIAAHGSCDVFVSHPTKTRLIAESRIKTDRVDSRALAELLRLDALPPSYMPNEETASLREMVRRRAYLVRERVRLKVKIRDYLVYNGVKTDELEKETGLFTVKGVSWLKTLNLEPVNMYLRVMSTFDEEVLKLSRDLKHVSTTDEDVKLLMTIPGIGYYSAVLIKSEIGTIDRFLSGEKLCSYAGLVPSVRSSGGHAGYGPITKQGSKWLRWVLVEAVHSHVIKQKNDTSISRFYHSLAARKGKQIAVVATARSSSSAATLS